MIQTGFVSAPSRWATAVSMDFFFFIDTATTEIYTLSLHDALPISPAGSAAGCGCSCSRSRPWARSEEHTSELQSQFHLVCRLLLEKKKRRRARQDRTQIGDRSRAIQRDYKSIAGDLREGAIADRPV